MKVHGVVTVTEAGEWAAVRMGVGLQPLEFTECLADSPQFRENLQRHEKELERTSQQIKRLIKEVKDVVQAAKRESLLPKLCNLLHFYETCKD